MGKVLTIKNGKNAWQTIQDVIIYSQVKDYIIGGNNMEIRKEINDFYVTTNIFVRYYNNKLLFFSSIAGVIVVVGLIVFLVVFKRRKKEDR